MLTCKVIDLITLLFPFNCNDQIDYYDGKINNVYIIYQASLSHVLKNSYKYSVTLSYYFSDANYMLFKMKSSSV